MKTKNSLIILFVVVAMIVGILFYVYNSYEKPKQENAAIYANLSIAVFDEEQHQLIIAILVKLNDVEVSNITTTSSGFVLIKVPVNSTVKLIAKDNKYYTSEVEYFVSQAINKRIQIDMISPGDINITSSLDKSNNQINLNIVSSDEFRNPIICTTWGLHIIWISSIDNLQQISPSDKYDKCFKINDINITEQMFSFVYDNYGVFDSSDFINFYVIDEKDNIEEKKVGLF